MHEDVEACRRAVHSKDERFDGWFFTAVVTTGIYCRPSCPVAPPRPQNMRFYPSAAAAQQAGYRACKRCRPDASPGSPQWNLRADLVARSMRMIADGVVDRDGVAGLAARLGYSVRQVERAVYAELGAGPLAVARAQRAQTARVLIETTDLPMTQIAYAAGFSSIRTFNDTVREVFAMTPSLLRSRRRDAEPGVPGEISIRLPFRRPLFPDNLFGHLAATAIPGVEGWRDGAYRRTLRLPHGPATVALAPAQGYIAARIILHDLRDLTTATSRCRWLLDLDADPIAVDGHLRADPVLAPLVRAAPGRRVPRCTDPAEMAIRAVIGQQVSTASARTHAARLVQTLGEQLPVPVAGLTHLFPTMAALAEVDPAALAMPRSRAHTIRRLAHALAEGEVDLAVGADWGAARAMLGGLDGIGPWTIQTIAMRALGDPDAFLATDLGVRRAAETLGLPTASAALEARSRDWRPWRAYAVQHLWGCGEHAVNRLPEQVA